MVMIKSIGIILICDRLNRLMTSSTANFKDSYVVNSGLYGRFTAYTYTLYLYSLSLLCTTNVPLGLEAKRHRIINLKESQVRRDLIP